MHEEEFIDTVRREASIESTDMARDVTDATLRTLTERISDGEAADIARHLPESLAKTLTDANSGEAEPFSLDEFTERVSERAEIDEPRVIASSRAVATALSAAAEAELETAREQLPPEFDVVFEPGGPITEDEFLEIVQECAGLDSTEAARSATVSTLLTLGERLTAGEAANCALYLPDAFAEALVETDVESATDYSLDEFVQRVARREDVEREDARSRAQAVCSTLAETVSERELDAAKKQLPDPFGAIFERPDGGA